MHWSFNCFFFNGSFDFHCLCVSFSAEPWLVDKRGGLRLPAGTEIETLRSQPANLKELLPEGGRGGVAVKCKRAMQALQMLSSKFRLDKLGSLETDNSSKDRQVHFSEQRQKISGALG